MARRFLEAAIEIAPECVRLVSVYGRRGDRESNKEPELTSKATYTVSQNAEPISHSGGIQCKVREVIPRGRILDAIVMEVVWPHCVWSQVAFRVLKRTPTNTHAGENNTHPAERDEQKSGDMSGTDEYLQKKAISMQELLRQDRVAIVPAFPDECRGMLSYEQCVKVQAEIERLLDLPLG